MISSSELKNFQNELMSPPITPKLMNDTSSTISTTTATCQLDEEEHSQPSYEEDDIMTFLPPSSQCLNDENQHHPNKRKETIGLSIRSIKLVNQDENDFYGKRFNFSKMIQPIPLSTSSTSSTLSLNKNHHYKTNQQQKKIDRRKSLPYKSPKGSPNNRMIFKMDVYHRPLQEKDHHENRFLSTSLPTSLSTPSLHHLHYASTSSLHTTIPNHHHLDHTYHPSHKKNHINLSLSIPSPNLSTSSISSTSSTHSSLTSPISPLKSSSLNEKPKADTQFYDHINLSIQDKDIYDVSWMPLWKDFDHRPHIRVVWKGSPLMIHQLPYYHELHTNECSIASTLRLSPEQYLKCKRALILTAQVFYQHGLPFRKSDAQKVCRIDVNKTSCLWNAFNRLGWFQPRHENEME
ncbi:unnamed protein product [Cunninghamella blakesleeana]